MTLRSGTDSSRTETSPPAEAARPATEGLIAVQISITPPPMTGAVFTLQRRSEMP